MFKLFFITSTRTDFNDNSSRFAKYLDVSFSKMGKVTGAKVSVFLLEHTRLLLAESEVCKNFHVFSLVFAGLKHLGRLQEFGIEKWVEKMLNFSDQLRRLKVDYYEYVTMKVIVLLTSGNVCRFFPEMAAHWGAATYYRQT